MELVSFLSLITFTCSVVDNNRDIQHIVQQSYEAKHGDGGWVTTPEERLAPTGPCTIEVRNAKDLSQKDFILEYAYTKPVVIKDASNNEIFRNLTRKQQLISEYGDSHISLSSANSYSYDKRNIIFREYCDEYMKPQALTTFGNETFYFFGDNGNDDWKPLLRNYNLPLYTLPKHLPQLSFGIAGPGSGVPFHFHGPGFAETIWGRKRWFMYPPHTNPDFHPNKTTLQWLYEDYPTIKHDPNLYECTLNPGELVYFPDHWWHATLNIDASVFISTFLGL